jgi:hypothetical protein
LFADVFASRPVQIHCPRIQHAVEYSPGGAGTERGGTTWNTWSVFLDAGARVWNMLSMRAVFLLCAVLVVGILIGRATAKIGSTESV